MVDHDRESHFRTMSNPRTQDARRGAVGNSAARGAGLLFILLAMGCGGSSTPPASADLPPVRVKILTVSATPHPVHEEVVGTVRARTTARVESKVSGRITRLLAAPGQSVKEGDLLIEVDAVETQARVDQAKAVLEQARRDHDRMKSLLASKVVSQQEADATEARLRVAQSSVAEAEAMVGYTQVRAPFDGIVTRKIADVGDLAMPGKPLLAIEAPGDLRFEADIPEAIIDNIHLGMELPVKLNAAREGALTGTVTEISPAADAVSRTFLVKLDLPENANLRTGQFGRALAPVGKSTTPLVPKEAVTTRGQMEFVTVVHDGRATLRIVRTGRALGDQIEIIAGLEPDEQIAIADSGDPPRDGQPVEALP